MHSPVVEHIVGEAVAGRCAVAGVVLSISNAPVLEAIAKITDHPVDQLRPEMELVADLSVDSAKALQLLVEIEDALGIEISDEEAEKLNTVGDVVDMVTSRTGDAAHT